MTLVVIQTGDGSHTLFETSRNIYFRSLQGAQSESEYVFLEASLMTHRPSPWRILELGFGTALNFLTTADRALQEHKVLEYHALEMSPLEPEVFLALAHSRRLKQPWLAELVAEAFEQAQQQKQVCLSRSGIQLQLYAQAWQDCELPETLEVDAVYHDPFGPKENPEAWSAACFKWVSRPMSAQARLVTYAAASSVRRAMVAAGLNVASLPGSGSKREMTVAAKQAQALADARLLPSERYRSAVP